MSRYAHSYRARDTESPPPQQDGDDSFFAMNMEQDRSTLKNGICALSINKRLATGRAATRMGTLTPVWANTGNGIILGSGIYNNPNDQEVILLATPTGVRVLRCGATPTTIPIPAGVTLSGQIEFGQDFNQIFLMGDQSGVTFSWDGVSQYGFVPIARNNPDDTTLALTPACAWSVDLADRRIFPLSRDSLGVTPIGDYTEYSPIPNLITGSGPYRVNAGTADPIVGAFPFGQGYLIVGKAETFDVLTNFTGDLSAAAMEVLSSEVGIAARRAAKMVGPDLIFPDHSGIFRITQVPQTQFVTSQPVTALQVNPTPVASTRGQDGRIVDPIGPIIRRINWNAASNMVAAVLSPYYFLAVPLDGSTWNNTILVYNIITDSWEGYDTWNDTDWRVDNLFVTDYQGTPHVYAVNSNTNSVHVLYEGHFDTTANGEFEVSDEFETRGYFQVGYDGGIINDALNFKVGVSTWRPSTTITLLTESAFDDRLLTAVPITRDRTKYYTWSKKDYDPTNSNDDFATPGREDYSVSLSNQPINLGSGMNVEQQQDKVLLFSTKARSRWKSFRFQNTQGRCDISGIIYESKSKQRTVPRRAG